MHVKNTFSEVTTQSGSLYVTTTIELDCTDQITESEAQRFMVPTALEINKVLQDDEHGYRLLQAQVILEGKLVESSTEGTDQYTDLVVNIDNDRTEPNEVLLNELPKWLRKIIKTGVSNEPVPGIKL